jgi:1,4-alpha-glucan branching enzyme
VIAFLRKSRSGDMIAFAVNATPVVREAYRVGVNGDGWWEEIINTDAGTYGGSNIGNYGGQIADTIPWQGKSHSLVLRLPPLAVVAFKRQA